MNTRSAIRILLVLAVSGILQSSAIGQSSAVSNGSVDVDAPVPRATAPAILDLNYTQPGPKAKLKNYLMYTVGPYPMAGAALVAASNQIYNTPPEWGQGAVGYAKRFGSDLAIDAVGTTSGYALAEIFHQDILYYRCECDGVLPRLRHALLSTLTARKGRDGHRVFSVPLLVAPYASTMAAVYGWYPDRFGAKDGFRMGNYYLLGSAAENIALEFVRLRHHSLRSHLDPNNREDSPDTTTAQRR